MRLSLGLRRIAAFAILFTSTAGPCAAATSATPTADLQYAQEEGILPLEFFRNPSLDGLVTRLGFTQAVIRHLYAAENFEGCFANIAPSHPVRFTKLFSDVPTNVEYAEDLCVAIHVGLIDGKRDGSFRPNEPITMAEAAKIVAKAYGFIYPSPLSDGGPWYGASMLALNERGALPTGIKPESTLTAKQMASMFYILRDQERYPLRRIIGNTILPSPRAGSTPVNQEEVMRTRTEHISRRTLLERMRLKAAEREGDEWAFIRF